MGASNVLTEYLLNSASKYNKLSVEAASGKKVSKPSDDPTATVNILKTNSSLSKLSAYSDNIKSAKNELDVLDSTLSSLNDSIQNATDLATQAANGTYSQSDLDNMKTQVDSILQSVVSLSNTQYNDKYIFSGTATDTTSYGVTYDTQGNISNIGYWGTLTNDAGYQRDATISDGVTVPVNAAGDKLYGSYFSMTTTTPTTTTDVTTTTTTTTTSGTGQTKTTITSITVNDDGTTTTATEVGEGLMGTLVMLSQSLAKGDTGGISASLDGLSNSLDTVSATRAQFASISNRLDLTQSSIDNATTQLTSYKSNLQDADLSQVLTELASAKLALEATYQVTSSTLGLSLLKYM